MQKTTSLDFKYHSSVLACHVSWTFVFDSTAEWCNKTVHADVKLYMLMLRLTRWLLLVRNKLHINAWVVRMWCPKLWTRANCHVNTYTVNRVWPKGLTSDKNLSVRAVLCINYRVTLLSPICLLITVMSTSVDRVRKEIKLHWLNSTAESVMKSFVMTTCR
jgi:hypothetical protein